MLSIQVLQKE
jgi:hypothetical protein